MAADRLPSGPAAGSGRHAASTCLLALTAGVALTAFYMIGAGTMVLSEPDEARSALIARHMVQSGDCLAPQLLDRPYFDKPPLFFWMLAASVRTFGESEWALRLPAAMITAATAVLTGLLAAQFFGGTAAWTAAASFAACAITLVNARLLRMDMFLALWVTAALLGWSRAFLLSKSSRWYIAMYAAMGLGCMTKGPVAIALPGLIILIYLFLSRPPRRIPRDLLAMRPLTGLLIVLLLYAPWVSYMTWRYPQYLWEFFGRQNLDRFAGSGMNASKPRWIIPATFFGGLMPWLPLIAVAGWHRRPRRDTTAADKLLWIWGAAVLAIFTVSKGRMPNYVLPALPPAFALLGGWMAEPAERIRRSLGWGLAATLGLMVLAVGGGAVAARVVLQHTDGPAIAGALGLLLILGIPMRLLWRWSPTLGLLPLLLAVVLGAGVAACGPIQAYCASRSTKPLAEPLLSLDPSSVEEIVMTTEPRYGAVFYAPAVWRNRLRHVEMADVAPLLPLLSLSSRPLYVILTGGGILRELQQDTIVGVHVSDRLKILQRCDSDAFVRIDPALPGPAQAGP